MFSSLFKALIKHKIDLKYCLIPLKSIKIAFSNYIIAIKRVQA